MRRLFRKWKIAFQIRYVTNPDREDTWLTLEDIRSQLPGGKWRHNRVYEDVSVATQNSMTLSGFWGLEEEDKAALIAYHRAKGTIEAYEHFLAEKRSKQARKN
jgi:hypothetical protein